MKKSNTSTRPRILFITLSNIGDVILTLPAFMRFAAAYPNAEKVVVAGPKAKNLLLGSRRIDELVIYDKKASFAEKIAFISKLRKNSYDAVVDLRHSMIPYMVSAKKRSPVFRKKNQGSFHDYHLSVLDRMGLPSIPAETFDFFNESDSTALDGKLSRAGFQLNRNFILMAPVAASGLKTWPLSNYSSVLKELLSRYDYPVVLIGDKREAELIKELSEIDSRRVLNAAGLTTLREAACLVNRSTLLIANDSALMHLGYELNRPTVAVFGPTSHIKYGQSGMNRKIVRAGSVCSPCENPRCHQPSQICFDDLKPELVLKACGELLEAYV